MTEGDKTHDKSVINGEVQALKARYADDKSAVLSNAVFAYFAESVTGSYEEIMEQALGSAYDGHHSAVILVRMMEYLQEEDFAQFSEALAEEIFRQQVRLIQVLGFTREIFVKGFTSRSMKAYSLVQEGGKSAVNEVLELAGFLASSGPMSDSR